MNSGERRPRLGDVGLAMAPPSLKRTNRDVELLQPVARGEPTMSLTGAGVGG
jgi:hypothetical protein